MNPSFIKINVCTGKTRNKYSVSKIKYIEGTNPTFEFDRDEPKDASSSDSSETRKSKHRNNAKTKEKILRNRGRASDRTKCVLVGALNLLVIVN